MFRPKIINKNWLCALVFIVFCFSCTIHRNHTENPKRRGNWFSWGRAGDTYNPVRDSKTKPSQQQAKDNAKVIRAAKKAVRKEKRRLRRTKGAYKKPK